MILDNHINKYISTIRMQVILVNEINLFYPQSDSGHKSEPRYIPLSLPIESTDKVWGAS